MKYSIHNNNEGRGPGEKRKTKEGEGESINEKSQINRYSNIQFYDHQDDYYY